MLKFIVGLVIFAVAANAQSGVVYLFDPTGVSGVSGNVTFTKTSTGVHINGAIQGLAVGKHGFHIHQLGHIAPGCTGTGGHFNPYKLDHGAPGDKVRHVGDLGNIVADQSGIANIDFVDSVIALEGQNCIIGRAVVVHEKEDDLGKGGNADSLVTGNAGGRVACGVIGIETEPTSAGTKMATSLGISLVILLSLIL